MSSSALFGVLRLPDTPGTRAGRAASTFIKAPLPMTQPWLEDSLFGALSVDCEDDMVGASAFVTTSPFATPPFSTSIVIANVCVQSSTSGGGAAADAQLVFANAVSTAIGFPMSIVELTHVHPQNISKGCMPAEFNVGTTEQGCGLRL